MIFEKEFGKIKNSPGFKEYSKSHKLSYLSSIFMLKNHKQFDFYDPETDKITSFSLSQNGIKQEESKVFRKKKTKVKELKLEEVNISLEEVKQTMSDLLEKHKQSLTKEFIILQKEKPTIWNISYITTEFKLLHVKIDAKTGKIIQEKIESILNLKA